MSNNSLDLTAAEAGAGLLVTLPAALILTAYVVDTAGWPINPIAMAILLALEAALAVIWAWPSHRRPHVHLDTWGLAGFSIVVVGFSGYIMWLARPYLLPISQSPDMVHHVSLIGFIQQRHSLVHDPSLWRYLGEMVHYSPGSHILAALVAAWLGTTGLRVLHPILALLVAVKAGIIYNLVLRLLPPSRRSPAVALAAALFLLISSDYLLGSFTFYYFYAQVVSETFAVAMLAGLVVWDEQRSPGPLAFFALCGIAVWLTWPLWLPVPVAALVGLLVMRQDITPRDKLRWLAWSVIPIAVVAAVYTFERFGATEVLKAEGGVLNPSLTVYGRPFLVLVALGIPVSLRRPRSWPLVLFAGAAALQTAALFVFDTYYHVISFYQALKMFYLMLYPMAVFAVLALEAMWHLAHHLLPAVWRERWPRFAVVLPVLVLTVALRRDLPSHPYSAISQSAYQAGVWSRAHLPSGCVDYLVDHWITAYWLHVDVLGNPRALPRTDMLISHFDTYHASMASWADSGRLPFAIVGDLQAIPAGTRADLTVLYQSGPAAVVQRLGYFACDDDQLPFDQVVVAPRGHTLAAALASLIPK